MAAGARRYRRGPRSVASQHREQRAEQGAEQGNRDHSRHEARRHESFHRIRKAQRGEQPPARAPAPLQVLAEVEQLERRRVGSVRERRGTPAIGVDRRDPARSMHGRGGLEQVVKLHGKHTGDDTRRPRRRPRRRLCGRPPEAQSLDVAASRWLLRRRRRAGRMRRLPCAAAAEPQRGLLFSYANSRSHGVFSSLPCSLADGSVRSRRAQSRISPCKNRGLEIPCCEASTIFMASSSKGSMAPSVESTICTSTTGRGRFASWWSKRAPGSKAGTEHGTDQNGADNELFHRRRQGKLALHEQDRAGNDAGVVAEEQPAESRDGHGDVDEPVDTRRGTGGRRDRFRRCAGARLGCRIHYFSARCAFARDFGSFSLLLGDLPVR